MLFHVIVVCLVDSGRLKHGRHFTFKSTQNDVAVTLVSSSVVGTIVTEETPYAAHGSWLQVTYTPSSSSSSSSSYKCYYSVIAA